MLGEVLLPRMPRPLSFWFGLYSGSLGALECVLVFFFLLSRSLSCVDKFKSFLRDFISVNWFRAAPFFGYGAAP